MTLFLPETGVGVSSPVCALAVTRTNTHTRTCIVPYLYLAHIPEEYLLKM